MMCPKCVTWRKPGHLIWVRSLPCPCCGGESEPHHIKGIGNLGGTGQKAPDWAVMPLCHLAHMEMHRNPALWPDQWEMIARTLGEAINQGVLRWHKI